MRPCNIRDKVITWRVEADEWDFFNAANSSQLAILTLIIGLLRDAYAQVIINALY